MFFLLLLASPVTLLTRNFAGSTLDFDEESSGSYVPASGNTAKIGRMLCFPLWSE